MTKAIAIQERWIEDLKHGNEEAANHLYKMYAKAMYNTLIRMTGSSEDAQDLLQEAFIKAFNNIQSFREESTFGTWLKRIVINTGLEFLRKKKPSYEIDEEHFVIPAYENNDVFDISTIHSEIKSLPEGCRHIFTLYLLEGYTHIEIAEQLGISVSTSKTQYMRAKMLLKERLTEIYEKRRQA
jgi:RNA polymerase sigma-70 factor (ECF subfamily)